MPYENSDLQKSTESLSSDEFSPITKKTKNRKTGVIRASKNELEQKTLPLSGYDWVEVEIDSASDEVGPMVTFVTLKSKSDSRYFLPLEVTPPQAAYIVLGRNSLTKEMAYQSSYHMLKTLAAVMDLHISRVIIDAAEPRFSKAKVEIRKSGDSSPLFYLDTSGGEAVTVAQMLEIPMYALKNQLIIDEEAED